MKILKSVYERRGPCGTPDVILIIKVIKNIIKYYLNSLSNKFYKSG